MILTRLVATFIGCKGNAQQEVKKQDYPLQKTVSEWKSELPQEFTVMRQSGTERAFISDLLCT